MAGRWSAAPEFVERHQRFVLGVDVSEGDHAASTRRFGTLAEALCCRFHLAQPGQENGDIATDSRLRRDWLAGTASTKLPGQGPPLLLVRPQPVEQLEFFPRERRRADPARICPIRGSGWRARQRFVVGHGAQYTMDALTNKFIGP